MAREAAAQRDTKRLCQLGDISALSGQAHGRSAACAVLHQVQWVFMPPVFTVTAQGRRAEQRENSGYSGMDQLHPVGCKSSRTFQLSHRFKGAADSAGLWNQSCCLPWELHVHP